MYNFFIERGLLRGQFFFIGLDLFVARDSGQIRGNNPYRETEWQIKVFHYFFIKDE
jgi:hypothetical protein